MKPVPNGCPRCSAFRPCCTLNERGECVGDCDANGEHSDGFDEYGMHGPPEDNQ